MISKDVFLHEMETLTAAFNYTLPERSIETYYSVLTTEFDDPDFQSTVSEIVRHNKRFPVVADFLEVKRAGDIPWYCRG